MNAIPSFSSIEKQMINKKILFITTKNPDYIRIVQELNKIRKYDKDCIVIVSQSKHYILRIIEVFLKVLLFNFKDIDLVFVGFQAQYIIPFLFWKFKSCNIWIDFFISMYDTLILDRKLVRKNTFSANIIWKLDQITIEKSHKIITDTVSHGQYFVEEFGAKPENTFVLYLEADKRLYHPLNIEKPKEWENKFVVFYFGSILPLQGVDIVLDAVEILKNEKEIHFIIVGPIGKMYKKIERNTVTYIEWLSQEKIAKYIAFSDLCLAGHFSSEIEKANRTIPGKAYIYEAMNKTMILGNSEANNELFFKGNGVRYVTRGDASELADEIKRVKDFMLELPGGIGVYG